jgi:homoserine kinase
MTNGARTARVRVPATTSNLGAGFDCIGMAVDLALSAKVEIDDSRPSDRPAITIRRNGSLASLALAPQDDAIYAGFATACKASGCAVPTRIAFSVSSEIPVGRGLGSSSAALVAGASLADATLSLGLGPTGIAELCTRIEGHPDNVGPAVFGGAILAVPGNGSVESRPWVFAPLRVHPDLAFVFVIPPFSIETALARSILPREVTHDIAVKAAGKSAALTQGLMSGDGGLLRIALDDVLHVPYRSHLVPGMASVRDAACAAGAYGATLSGSGPALVAVAPQEAAERVAVAMMKQWTAEGVRAESFVQRRPANAGSAIG